MDRVFNFAPGPSALPLAVLEKVQKDLLCYGSTGMSVMEMSHRSKMYLAIYEETEALFRELMGIPEDYSVLMLQGGATLQFAAVAMNLMTGDQYISIILSSNMFKDEYTRQGYESRLLSRSTEDSATVVSVLIPWNTCGMTQATVLGVATLTYLPYTFFCLLSPLMSIIHAAFGWKIKRHEEWSKEGER